MFLFAIRDSQQPASSIGFLLLKLLPLPCALLLVLSDVLSPGALRKTRCIKEAAGFRSQVSRDIPRQQWWDAYCSTHLWTPLKVSRFHIGLPSFLLTGPCWSIESQQNGYGHQLERQWNWQERSQGLVLGTGVCGYKMESRDVPVDISDLRDLWDFSAVGRVFRCWASGSFQKSHWEWDGNKMKVGRGRVFWHS